MKLYILLLLFAIAELAICSPKKTVKTPVWSRTYSVKGTLYIPYAEISEPFYAWYDGKSSKSRIDYYGGMVKTYQLGKEGPYGASLKVAPITTESETNAETCLAVNGSKEASIEPQSILPDLTGFECVGEEMINGKNAEKWQLNQIIDQKQNKYTLWMNYISDSEESPAKIPVPVKYEMKGYNSLLGSHYDHYYLEYDEFSVDDVPSSVFVVDADLPCQEFPGPGLSHIYTFNPMREFVHPVETGHVDHEFNRFRNKHGKKYETERELTKRKNNFQQNLRFIHSVNRARKSYSLEVNHLADWSQLEMKALRGKMYSGVYNGGKAFPYTDSDGANLPEQFDWRLYGAVTPVKDQSVCGSCWSFGTVGAIEGAFFLKNGGKLVRLSQQALVDCSWGYGNNGCDGGEDFRAYQWMLKHGGIPTEEEYGPYLGQDGYCHVNNVSVTARITGWVNVTQNNPIALKTAILKHGPVSVAIDASHRTLSFYSNGVYYEPKCGNKEDQLDHAVLAVGFGTMNGKDYWLIKNSWSNYWGNDGYVLMAAQDNNCGVMTTPTYVTM